MQEFNDELGTTASGAAIIIGDRDETRLNNMVTLADGPDSEDVTTFQPTGNAKEYAYLLNSGTVSVKGFLATDAEIVREQLAQVLGKSREKPLVIVGKYGLAPGTEANFARALSNTHNANYSLTGVTSADASLALTGTGIVDGVSLHRVFGDTAPGQSEVQKLVFANADPNTFRGLRAVGTTEVFPFDLTTTNAALGAGIAALSAYAGRVVTVTGDPLTGATNKSGERRIAFDGAVDVPQLEIVSGLVESLAVAGGVGNYTLNGGAQFQLGVTEGALQTNQRNLGAARAGVVMKGSSVVNTAPGKSQTVSGSGGALSIGAEAVNFATDTVASFLGRLNTRIAPRVLTGSGTIAKSQEADATSPGQGNPTVTGGASTGSAAAAFDDNPATSIQLFVYDEANNGANYSTSYVNYTFASATVITAIKSDHYQGPNQYTNGYVEGSASGNFSDAVRIAPASGAFSRNTRYAVANNTPFKAIRFVANDPDTTLINLEILATQAASANITLTDAASAGNPLDLPITGTGYASNSALSNPNGSANFKAYYPLNAAPAAPAATGLNAVAARLNAPTDISAATIQRSTGLDANFSYNFVNASDADEWIDYGVASPDGFHLVASILEANGDNASLAIIVETADADGAGAPVPGSIVTLHEFAPFTERGYSMISDATPVKRLIRVRYVVTGGGEYVFAVAIAPR